MTKARKPSGKDKAALWIKRHCDGNYYTTRQISKDVGVSPAVVRSAITSLHRGKVLFAQKGKMRGRNTRWQFFAYHIDPSIKNDGPDAIKELLTI